MLPDATALVDYMLNRYTDVLNNLVVYEKQMLKNINSTHGVIFAQRVMNKLILNASLTREQAYDLIQPIAMEAHDKNVNFKTLLLENKTISKKMSPHDLQSCFTMEYYFDKIPYIYQKVLNKD
jgi:adenylosuccinate lyase